MLKALSQKNKSVCIALGRGCGRVEMDNARLFKYFQANGWNITRRIQDADLVLLTGCGFSFELEEKSIKFLRLAAQKMKKDSKLIVTGCLAGISKERINQEFGAATIPPVLLDNLDEIINAKIRLAEFNDPNWIDPFIRASKACWQFKERNGQASTGKAVLDGARQFTFSILDRLGIERMAIPILGGLKRLLGNSRITDPIWPVYHIRIAKGCCEKCTYCAIRFAGGPLRSKPLVKVMEEFERGLKQGYRLFDLVAQDIGPYGQDIGTNLLQLLRGFFSYDGNYRLILSDLNAKYLILYMPEVIELLAENSCKIYRMVVPVQSGSERILGLMKRDYTSGEIRECLGRLLALSADISLETHVLVGFPGETERDFKDTVELLRDICFTRINVYKYSDRPNTSSSCMPDKVTEEIKNERVCLLLDEFPEAYCP